MRESDLKDALKKVRREAESRFDAGASPQAAAFAAERKRRQADRDRRRQEAEAEVRQAEAALAALGDRARLADGVTFFGYLARQRRPGLTTEVMARPLVEANPVRNRRTRRSPKREARATPGSATEPSGILTADPASRERARPGGKPATRGCRSGEAPSLRSAARAELRFRSRAHEPPPSARLRTVAGLGLAVAKADGRIAAAERKQVRAFLERRYATDPASPANSIRSWREVEADLPTLGDALWEVKRTIPAEAWPELYQFAVSVADAAGERNTREVECLARVAEELGIGIKPPPAHVPAPVVATEPDAPLTEPECRAALEIAPETPLSVDLIRRQYRLLSDRFAPEKFASHGPEFVQMAADKRDKAERAARHLLAGYNEPLEAAAPPPRPTCGTTRTWTTSSGLTVLLTGLQVARSLRDRPTRRGATRLLRPLGLPRCPDGA